MKRKGSTSRHCTAGSKVSNSGFTWNMKLSPSFACVCIHKCTDGYNQYMKLIRGAIGAKPCAALQQGNKIYTIDDDIPLLHFLSGKIHLA